MDIHVNDKPISEQAIYAEMQYHPALDVHTAYQQAMQALVIRELLLQRAYALNIHAEPVDGENQEEALMAVLLAREVQTPEPDEESCLRYYAQNHARFHSPDVFEVSHILLAAPPQDAEARAQAKQRAEDLIAILQAQPQRFAELAAAHSDCPSKQQGGNLGQVSKGQTVAEFERALGRMHTGELSKHALESRYGYHIIYVHRCIHGEPLPFELVQARIRDYLRVSVQQRAISQYLQSLISAANIQGVELAGADSPLMQ